MSANACMALSCANIAQALAAGVSNTQAAATLRTSSDTVMPSRAARLHIVLYWFSVTRNAMVRWPALLPVGSTERGLPAVRFFRCVAISRNNIIDVVCGGELSGNVFAVPPFARQ